MLQPMGRLQGSADVDKARLSNQSEGNFRGLEQGPSETAVKSILAGFSSFMPA